MEGFWFSFPFFFPYWLTHPCLVLLQQLPGPGLMQALRSLYSPQGCWEYSTPEPSEIRLICCLLGCLSSPQLSLGQWLVLRQIFSQWYLEIYFRLFSGAAELHPSPGFNQCQWLWLLSWSPCLGSYTV